MSAPGARHPDRVGVPAWLVGTATVAAAVALGVSGHAAAQGQLTPEGGLLAGAAVATLAMLGLPSLSVRWVARVLVLVSAAVLVRFGSFSGSLVDGGQLLLVWLVAAVTVFVVTDRIGVAAAPAPTGPAGEAPAAGPAPVARSVLGVAAVVAVAAAVLAPLILPVASVASRPGQGASLDPFGGGAGALRPTDSLDMTTRPDLTDDVVFTVDTDRATFWRGETFDVWDGRRWTRSQAGFDPLAPGGRVRPAPDDLAAAGSDEVRQRFRLETSYAEVLYGAPSIVQVDVDAPVRQRPDGTLVTAPLGRDTTYTVTSRRALLSPERLRATDRAAVPAEVADRYARPPTTTDRVRQVATEITRDAPTTYDKVLALEAWMGRRVTYSLDAPLAPKGVDVVDHFLFDAEQGWCEQIASSLVVLARANGIPARLATGYVPGDRDPVTGVFTVRARDAHAWAEVWFPEVGWVPFDPTADVALAGSDVPGPTVAGWLRQHAVVLVLALAVVALAAGPLRRLVVRLRARRRARPQGWAARTDAELDRLGRAVDRARRPDETATAYGRALARRYRDDRLAAVGELVDDACYAARPPDVDRQRWATAVLAEARAAGPVDGPDREPVPVP